MEFAWLVTIGLVAGISSGLFGIGGGVLIVPALMFLLHFPIHKAVGTSLAVLLLPVGIGAVIAHFRSGNIDWKAACILAICLLLGAWAGARLANAINGQALRTAFGVFLLGLGIYTLLGPRG